MITKQQALEFIDGISNSFSISMDLTKGIDCYFNVYSDSCGTFGVEGDFNFLEEAVTEFIKRFGNTTLLEDLKCLIPVDKYRVPDEIIKKLNKMEPPDPNFVTRYFDPKQKLTITNRNIRFLQDKAFDAGYKQAVKEMKEYFGIEGVDSNV